MALYRQCVFPRAFSKSFTSFEPERFWHLVGVPSRKGILRTTTAVHHQRNQAVVISLKRCFPSGDPPPAMLRRSNTWRRLAYAMIRILSPPLIARHCETRFTADASGRITNWNWQGNACKATAPKGPKGQQAMAPTPKSKYEKCSADQLRTGTCA
jgi:hypothetical protein